MILNDGKQDGYKMTLNDGKQDNYKTINDGKQDSYLKMISTDGKQDIYKTILNDGKQDSLLESYRDSILASGEFSAMKMQRRSVANDQYSQITPEQIRNNAKISFPFFHTKISEGKVRSGAINRYTNVINSQHVRGDTQTSFVGFIDFRRVRRPADEFDTCRGRAAVRWGPVKQGERTRSHYFGEDVDRYTMVDAQRRPATCYPGRVVTDCGRPADGYYTQKYPAKTTWFNSSAPLNRRHVLESVRRKTWKEYEEVEAAERLARQLRVGAWPEFTEYTDRFLLQTATPVAHPQPKALRSKETRA